MSLVQGFKYRVSSGKNPFVVLLGPAEETLLPFYRERLAGSRIPEDRGEIMFSPDKEALTGLLRSARLYIGHDSGITHLAAMFGTPTIALFKNSRADQWGPLGPRVKVIEGREGSLALIDEVYKVARELVP
jgi:ADP-heptose:LPS heptosyltransferase